MNKLKYLAVGLIVAVSLFASCHEEYVPEGSISFDTGLEFDTAYATPAGAPAKDLFDATLKELLSVSSSSHKNWKETYVGLDSLDRIVARNIPVCESYAKEALEKVKAKKVEFLDKIEKQDWGTGTFKIVAYGSYYYDGMYNSVVVDSVAFNYPQ